MKLLVVCNSADLGRAGWPARPQAAAVGGALFQLSLIFPLGQWKKPKRTSENAQNLFEGLGLELVHSRFLPHPIGQSMAKPTAKGWGHISLL